jgi:hypothetical protein
MPATRRFAIHDHETASSRAQLVEGAGFEEAALRFVEAFHPAAEADDAVSLMVEDCDTGERQCFTIDLHTGETTPCD